MTAPSTCSLTSCPTPGSGLAEDPRRDLSGGRVGELEPKQRVGAEEALTDNLGRDGRGAGSVRGDTNLLRPDHDPHAPLVCDAMDRKGTECAGHDAMVDHALDHDGIADELRHLEVVRGAIEGCRRRGLHESP